MKKNILKICMVAVLTAAVLAVGVAAVTGNLGFFVSGDGIAERTDLPQSFDIKFMSDETIRITYDKSRSVMEGFADIYKDEKGNEYIYKNGKLNGYYSNENDHPANDTAPIGKEAATETAEKWLARFVENPDKFGLQTFEEKENYGQYYVTFARMAGEIFTEQTVEISVMYDGGVKYVQMHWDGKYDNVSDDIAEGVTEDSIEAYAHEQISIIYPDKEDNFIMERYCLEEDENGYYIVVYGKFDYKLECLRYDFEESSGEAKVSDNTFPVKPDKIIVGTGGTEKEILTDDKEFDKIVSFVRERADKSDYFGALLLAAYDPETDKHFSYGLRESETFVEFIYDECKGQILNMSQSGGGSAQEEMKIKRIFLSLTGEYHDCFFYSEDDNYESAGTLGTLTDNTELITYVRELIE